MSGRRPARARSTTGASTCRSANPCRKKTCKSDARAVATTPDDANRKEVAEYEALAEKAYDDMYDSRSPAACYSDLKDYFRSAIDAANRAGLKDETERLTKRLV